MLFNFALYPLEISLNAIGYLLGVFLPEFRDKPGQSLTIALAVIAAIYALTQRDNIQGCSTWALRVSYGYPMIGSNCVPQTGWASAYGAATVEILKATSPIAIRESPFDAALTSLIGFLCCLANAFPVFGLMVFAFISSRLLLVFVSVSLIYTARLLRMIESPTLVFSVDTLRIVFGPLTCSTGNALSAGSRQSPVALREIKERWDQPCPTLGTFLKREGFVDHLKNSLAGLANRARLGKAAKQALSAGHDSRLFRGPVSIIPQEAALWR
jgi:hypothetical protein